MTVAELIAELQRHQAQKEVRVVMSQVFFRDESGETMVPIAEEEAERADDVRNEGPYVLIRGR